MIRFLAAILPAILVVGCAAPTSTISRPDAYYDANPAQVPEDSLFSGDEAVLSDSEIERILAFDYSPPKLSRIEAARSEDDFNMRETMLKAQLRATEAALADVSNEIVSFLLEE